MLTIEQVEISPSNYIIVRGFGIVGLWWKHADKSVKMNYSFGESFIAETEEEVRKGVIDQMNNKKTLLQRLTKK